MRQRANTMSKYSARMVLLQVMALVPGFAVARWLLGLKGNKIKRDGARALANAPQLGRLERLDLGSNWICTEGARALGWDSQLRSLRQLNVSHNNVDEEIERKLGELCPWSRW